MSSAPTVTVLPAEFPRDQADTARLFFAYAASLPSHIDLAFQSFQQEVAQLPGKYSAENGGALFLAWAETPSLTTCIGCVGVRSLNAPDTCELKRLYTLPEARGLGAGGRLMDAALSKAKDLGYKEMLLDTLSVLKPALRLYAKYGFEETAKYYNNPYDGVIFMKAKLQ